ncbi:MAG: hypothetical protein AUI47_10910 [Acidobacteria bacterium 13_1_40CM_2_68_5]|nr:MAG: hypothetical protein AUI47_10910 [Acidobacteria bacterium 13_1_40CM_2_68_5]
MRKTALLVCAIFAVGVMLAQAHPVSAAGKTHNLIGTVVSVDLEAKKITFTDDTGSNMTAPVLDKAMASLKKVKAGDKVTLTCQDNDKGDHEGVAAIKIAKTEKASKK